MSEWRYLRYRPGAAHLWTVNPSGLVISRCGRMVVRDLHVTTVPLLTTLPIPQCKPCLRWEAKN